MPELQAGACIDACIYSVCDDDGPDGGFCVATTHRARQEHKCCECHAPISPRTLYETVVGKWYGEFMTYKTCLPCAEIRGALCCEGWTYTRLWADARESIFERLTTGCLEKLATAAAKEKLLSEWRRWKFGAERAAADSRNAV